MEAAPRRGASDSHANRRVDMAPLVPMLRRPSAFCRHPYKCTKSRGGSSSHLRHFPRLCVTFRIICPRYRIICPHYDRAVKGLGTFRESKVLSRHCFSMFLRTCMYPMYREVIQRQKCPFSPGGTSLWRCTARIVGVSRPEEWAGVCGAWDALASQSS
jgi:hypothetical protein